MVKLSADHETLLENIRDNPIGSIQFQLQKSKDSKTKYVRSAYMDYTRKAFNEMIHAVQVLENAHNTSLLFGMDYVNCVSLWFLSIESFVSDILEIIYYFNPLRRVKHTRYDGIKAKIQKIVQISNFSAKQYQQTGFLNRIEEFSKIRNSIFHGTYPHESATIQKTKFYADMMQWNLVDCLYAYKIAMETFHLFDLLIPKIRLMPQVPLTMGNATAWIFLDDLHKEYLIPYFYAVLKKHNLNTKFDPTIFADQFINSVAIPIGRVRALIYVNSSEALDLSTCETTLNKQYLRFLEKYLPASDMIKIPDMRRNNL